VVKIGGHLLDEGEASFSKYATQIKSLVEAGHRIAVVVGGGNQARRWIELLRTLGSNEAALDEIGIMVSRLNAYVLIQCLPQLAYPLIPTTMQEFDSGWVNSNVVVMGGLTPGQSTTAVAAILAERVNADRLIILTNVDGVYTENPAISSSEFLPQVHIDELAKIVSQKPAFAGTYDLVDDVLIKVLRRSKIPTIITNGRHENIIIEAALFKARGTTIIYE